MCGLKLVFSLLLLCMPACYMANEAIAQPERCKLPKPSKTPTCLGNKSSRYFFHSTKGCKRSGFCDPEDTSIYDQRQDQNYFLTKESCVEACQMNVRCPTLEPIANGTVSNGGVGYWGSSVEYSCDNGFMLSGRAIRTCESTGVWTSEAPSCIAKCPRPNTDGPFTFSPLQQFYTPGDTIVYNCKQGFGQVGENEGRVCQDNGTWSGKEITCEVELQCTKEALSPIEHGTVFAPDSRGIGSRVSFSCDDGYLMYGSATVDCNKNAEWSGPQPICWRIEIEMCEESDPKHDGAHTVTNTTISLEQGERNLWFIPSITKPNPFTNKTFEWDEEITKLNLPGVSIVEDRLKITTVFATRALIRKYFVSFCGYNAFFGVDIVEASSNKKPKALFHPQDVTISLGDNLEIMCVFDGCPTPNVTWFHNNGLINIDDKRTVQQQPLTSFTKSTLTVQSVTSEDLGSYRCVGNNGLGYQVSSSSGSVTLASRKRRSVEEEAHPSLCVSKTPSSDIVTIVGRVRRQAVKLGSPTSTVYRMKVENVLSSGAKTLSKNVQTIVLDQDAEAQQKLSSNALYILQGRLHENTLLVQSHNSILNHSLELEHSVQQC